MKPETAKQKESRVNELLTDCYSESQALDNFIYLTNKNRNGGTTTEKNILTQYRNRNLAQLIKRLDPTAYNLM